MMRQNLHVLNIALRVLTAITEKHEPDQADVAELEAIAGPKPEGRDWDEFTCDVIKLALSHRAEVRKALGAQKSFGASD